MSGARARTFALAVCGVGLVLVAGTLARIPDWLQSLRAFQLLFFFAFALYGLALAILGRTPPRATAIVLAVAVAARLALLPAKPSLSDDVYRYAWEGKVILHGGNPYRQRPLDPALAPLRDATIYPAVNHPHLATIYPPLAEAGFALVAAIRPTVTAFKLWVVLHDLALVALLARFLARRGRDPAWAAVYAWNPLVLVEAAGSGHNDPTALVWLVAALYALERRPTLSALALAAGALVKLVPLLALPFLWRRWPPRARLACAAVLVPGLAWYLAEAHGEASGLHAYWSTWRNNELLFHYLERLGGGFAVARWVAAGIVIAVMAIAWMRQWDAVRATRAAFRTALLSSPVAHPWYQLWNLAFEPFAPSAPWIVLSATAIVSYGVLATPAEGRSFHLSLAWRWIEYGVPALLAIGIAAARSGRARGVGR